MLLFNLELPCRCKGCLWIEFFAEARCVGNPRFGGGCGVWGLDRGGFVMLWLACGFCFVVYCFLREFP